MNNLTLNVSLYIKVMLALSLMTRTSSNEDSTSTIIEFRIPIEDENLQIEGQDNDEAEEHYSEYIHLADPEYDIKHMQDPDEVVFGASEIRIVY